MILAAMRKFETARAKFEGGRGFPCAVSCFRPVGRCVGFHIGRFREMWAKGWGAWSVLAKKGAGNAYPFLNRCSVELYPTRKGVRDIEKKGKPLPMLGQKSA